VHDPFRHVSVCVQEFPSLHARPSAAAGFEQFPVTASQIPDAWHWSNGRHATGAPSQSPPWHASFVVHRSPSLQDEPSGSGTAVHAPLAGSHRLARHASLARQTTTSDVPRRIETWLLSDRDTEKSGLPSRLKSEIANWP
jgi:hypothetical protein